MGGLVLALLAAYGTHLVHTSLALGWTGVAPGPQQVRTTDRATALQERLRAAGFDDVPPAQLLGAAGALFLVGALLSFALFGGVLPPLAGGTFAASFPVAAARSRRERRRLAARDSWPRLIEEVRIKTTTLGRSIPQALFEVGARAPEDMRPAFATAHREWLLSTDFDRTLGVLREHLADATADTVCETLLVAHQVGSNDVDRSLTALAEDRVMDLQGRKDADAKQAGARFARRFVLVVPLAMAAMGLSIGNGRASYASATGQLLVVAAITVMAACWLWAGHIMRLPSEQRVLRPSAGPR
jgi:tight adherence protein B